VGPSLEVVTKATRPWSCRAVLAFLTQNRAPATATFLALSFLGFCGPVMDAHSLVYASSYASVPWVVI
jgi:hypothetical protein